MSKKILIPIVIAVVAALLIGGVALAAGNAPQGKTPTARTGHQAGLGQITALGDDQFTVQLQKGGSATLQVDENTRFLTPAEEAASFGDLAVGRWVMGVAKKEGDTLLARRVVLLPADCDPSQISERLSGLVLESSANIVRIHLPSGENLTVKLEDDTVYLGAAVQSPADLQEGMAASFGVRKLEDGSLLAVLAAARPAPVRHAGEVTNVDAAGKTFTLRARNGAAFTFRVDAETQFVGRKGVESLDELKTGMLAGVSAAQQKDGSLLAVRVAAGEKADLKVAGKISAIQGDTFTLAARNGQTYTFQVNADTRFRSPAGKGNGLKDLKVGQRLGVGAQELEDGAYLALTVIIQR